MPWSLAASMMLVAVVTAWALGRWREKTATPDAPSRRDDAAKPGLAAVREPERALQVPKSCPVCLSEYPTLNRFCVRDGAALVEGRSSGPFAQGMICPACRRGYPADACFCPEDAEELVPYGLYGAASSTRRPFKIDANKICPECGIHHAPSHLFCRQDGTELVTVN